MFYLVDINYLYFFVYNIIQTLPTTMYYAFTILLPQFTSEIGSHLHLSLCNVLATQNQLAEKEVEKLVPFYNKCLNNDIGYVEKIVC